eukprot:TRINITY_DN3569_c2_g1_i1.p1 TRINITY_DN3569_c2_g1~~TRINITY_DN3569_c2_g1_i1.p1  ORF type:complete len:827 (-),score=244.81 TRINITY_DN3569_c2_g1_i1:359-2839(-)
MATNQHNPSADPKTMKYKVQIKVKSVEGLSKSVKSVLLTLGSKSNSSITTETPYKAEPVDGKVSFNEAKWKYSLKIKDQEEIGIELLEDTKKQSRLAKIKLDLVQFAQDVPPGQTKKFPLTKAVNNITFVISLSLARNGPELPKTVDPVEDKETTKKTSTPKEPKSSSSAKSPRVDKASTESKSSAAASSSSSKKSPRTGKPKSTTDNEAGVDSEILKIKSESKPLLSEKSKKIGELSSPRGDSDGKSPLSKSTNKPTGLSRAASTPPKQEKISHNSSEDLSSVGSSSSSSNKADLIMTPFQPAHRLLFQQSNSGNESTPVIPAKSLISRGIQSQTTPAARPTNNSDVDKNRNAKTQPTRLLVNSNAPSTASPKPPVQLKASSRPTKFNTIHQITFEKSDVSTLQQSNTNSPASSSVKYPTFGSRNNTRKKIRLSSTRPRTRSGTDIRVNSSSNSSGIDIAALTKDRKQKQQEENEKWLIENIIRSTTLTDVYVAPYIIFNSLLHWDAFSSNPVDDDDSGGEGVQLRLVEASSRAIAEFSESRIMLFQWLNTCVTLTAMADKHLKVKSESISEDSLLQFMEDVQQLTNFTFESILNNFTQTVGPVLSRSLTEFLGSRSADKLVLDEEGLLSHVFPLLHEYCSLVISHGVFDGVKYQVFKQLFHAITANLLDACTRTESSSFQGIQLKLIITKFEDLIRNKYGNQYAKEVQQAMEPARQAANILCLPSKKNLVIEKTRNEVYPNLTPNQLIHLLTSYHVETDEEEMPKTLLEDLEKLSDVVTNDDVFDPNERPPLLLDFDLTLEIPSLTLPKTLLDRPGFAFLKNQR